MKNYKTVKLDKCWHVSPAKGACVMELVSLLADEEFSPHPACVPEDLATAAAIVNDSLPDDERTERMLPLAPRFIGVSEVRAKEIVAALSEVWPGEDLHWSWRPWPEREQLEEAARLMADVLDRELPAAPTMDDLAWDNLDAIKKETVNV